VKTANIILNVATSLILAFIGNFKLNERVINFSSKSIKFNKLCHKIEDLLFNSIDDVTTENIKSLIDEYDNIMDNYFRSVEDGSRFLIEKYVKPDMNVLELGAKY
jgi:fructose-1,6-bisphosphatase